MPPIAQPNSPDPKIAKDLTADQAWYQFLTEGEPAFRHMYHLFGIIPSNPRCKVCNAPFQGVGAPLMRLMGKRRSIKNPRYCSACEGYMANHQGGAEIELTMLFIDVRGSTTLAERMNATEFSRLLNRFYEETTNVLIHADALVDKLVGDEVVALFIPGYAGREHAQRAVQAGQALLSVVGYGQPDGPWVPVGVGIHTGVAWVGAIAGATTDFTALGDNVNITARLASKAGPGEVLVSEVACVAAQVDTTSLEKRDLELKGKSELVSVRVLRCSDNKPKEFLKS